MNIFWEIKSESKNRWEITAEIQRKRHHFNKSKGQMLRVVVLDFCLKQRDCCVPGRTMWKLKPMDSFGTCTCMYVVKIKWNYFSLLNHNFIVLCELLMPCQLFAQKCSNCQEITTLGILSIPCPIFLRAPCGRASILFCMLLLLYILLLLCFFLLDRLWLIALIYNWFVVHCIVIHENQ